jgi:poly-gamma-glutamate capsule biosynthesis protein CapA/YwtB (metallophosphatase superfamily)
MQNRNQNIPFLIAFFLSSATLLAQSVDSLAIAECPVARSITISAVGDCTLGAYKGQALGNRFDEVAQKEGSAYFFQAVKSVFENSHLNIANLEGPLTQADYTVEKQFPMRGKPEHVEILKHAGIHAVSLANNHTFDCGEQGYKDTQQVLDTAHILHFGGSAIAYQTINGIRVAMLGAKGWVINQAVKENLKKQIIEARQNADLVIIYFHWGEEGENFSNKTQQALARHSIDCGADLVLGAHPHVVQGLETYKGKQIVYSLGNFCFGGNKNPRDKDTFIYQITFHLTDEGIVEAGTQIIPCSLSSVKDRNDFRPVLLEGADKERVLKRLADYSVMDKIK